MTRYAIVRDGKRYYAVPDREAGAWPHVHCHYTGHYEAAVRFARAREESERKDGTPASMRRNYHGDAEKRRRAKGIAYGRIHDEADANAEPNLGTSRRKM